MARNIYRIVVLLKDVIVFFFSEFYKKSYNAITNTIKKIPIKSKKKF